MAVIVIQKGIPPETRRMWGKCVHCTAVIECTQGDTKARKSADPGHYGDRGDYLVVTCPTCFHDIVVDYGIAPTPRPTGSQIDSPTQQWER